MPTSIVNPSGDPFSGRSLRSICGSPTVFTPASVTASSYQLGSAWRTASSSTASRPTCWITTCGGTLPLRKPGTRISRPILPAAVWSSRSSTSVGTSTSTRTCELSSSVAMVLTAVAMRALTIAWLRWTFPQRLAGNDGPGSQGGPPRSADATWTARTGCSVARDRAPGAPLERGRRRGPAVGPFRPGASAALPRQAAQQLAVALHRGVLHVAVGLVSEAGHTLVVVWAGEALVVPDHVARLDPVAPFEEAGQPQRGAQLAAVTHHLPVALPHVLDPDGRVVEAHRVAAHPLGGHELVDRPVCVDDV